jgi:hypothetical protein
MRKPRGELFFSAERFIHIHKLHARGRERGLTEDERRVGLLEPCEVPKVGRLAELVASREMGRVGNENEEGGTSQNTHKIAFRGRGS